MVLGAVPAAAQLSPGDLSRPHESLEGLRRCRDCHRLGDREVSGKCLECHVEIAVRRDLGKGLHAGSEFSVCTDCHVEHQGRDHELIRWPDGRDAFDHRKTGHRLEGKHAATACRDCHKAGLIAAAAELREAGKDLDRTFLGLDTVCASCHQEPHRPSFTRTCDACHDQNAWKPAPGFQHGATAFPLTGKHADTACDRCHAPLDADAPVPGANRYQGVAHTSCTDCHQDHHAGRLGPNCTDCHTTASWAVAGAVGFDHDRTRYPLRGRHAALACDRCHGGDRARPAFDACIDCHRDQHDGAARGRPDLRRCDECHDVQGFRPSRYPFARHADSAFPLAGAHQAVACDQCHRRDAGTAFALRLPHGDCTACHADPHGPAPEAGRACTGCHGVESWRPATFDHASTGTVLTDAHARAACRACHAGAAPDDAPRFAATPTACAACHQDIHAGQFAADDAPPACDRCHVTRDWFAERFDHERDSRFALRGGHERVACDRCHQPLEGPDARSLRFKPVATACEACHVPGTVQQGVQR
ncbi:MAG TPA: hypothetical protein P5571_00690 [Candidatus Krumholzibacteria bacterium]|nr:hypothetical protein [Candidatus Krumholzibacteria bacterium]HRX49871.1 hypothetical protein [Candidatus Krumholzibacteria bacterium]